MKKNISAILSLMLAACAPLQSHVISYNQAQVAKLPDTPVAIMDAVNVKKPYIVVGFVKVRAHKHNTSQEIIDHLKFDARSLGGDALIDLQTTQTEEHGWLREFWTAKVIKWSN